MRLTSFTIFDCCVGLFYSRWDEWRYFGVNRFPDDNLIYLHMGKFSIEFILKPKDEVGK